MSRSSDSLEGNQRQGLLSDENDAELGQQKQPPPPSTGAGAGLPPSHRKTQSLFSNNTTSASSSKHNNNNTNNAHRNRHHRARSSIGQMMETINEGVQEEARVLQETWKAELEEGDIGNRYFFDMSMTRSLSVLPDDIWEFAHEAVENLSERDSRRSSFNPLLSGEIPSIPHTPVASLSSYAALLSAVLAVSSNATALAMLHDVHPALKLFWRMTAVATVLSFFALKTMIKRYREEGQFFPRLTPSQWLTFGAAAVCFFVHTMLAFTALTLTSIGNAVIGANSQALLLVLGKLLTGQEVVFLEGLGVLLAFGGCILCASDEAHGGRNDKGENGAENIDTKKALIGDMMALGSAAFGVGYLTFAKSVRSHVSVTVFMFMVMLSGCVLCILYMTLTQVDYTLDNDPRTGLFGWMTLVNHHVFIVLYIAFICNVIGTMGFVRAMEYFDNIVIAVATLLEPMIATLIAFALGVGDLPGTFGWTGNLLVAIGTLGVVYPSVNKPGGGGGGH